MAPVHDLMLCLLAECFLMLPLKQFSPFTAFSPPKGKQRYLKLIKSKQQRSQGEVRCRGAVPPEGL